jgi:hypothetical protein
VSARRWRSNEAREHRAQGTIPLHLSARLPDDHGPWFVSTHDAFDISLWKALVIASTVESTSVLASMGPP